MSTGVDFLHNHSGLERELRMEKRSVLVDEKYKDLFCEDFIEKFPYHHGNEKFLYYKVPTLEFFNKGGVFKNYYK